MNVMISFDDTQPIDIVPIVLTHSEYWSINNQRAKEFVQGKSWDEISFVNLMNILISLSKLT